MDNLHFCTDQLNEDTDMTNVVNIASNADTALDRIIADIAQEATNMVKGAHRIGTLLNEARAILGDDAFGLWRSENVIEPMGISKRTCQRMQNIAERFTEETLPNISLSVLYIIASDSVQPTMQEALIELADVRAKAGKKLTVQEAGGYVAKSNQGRITGFDVKQEAVAEAKAARVEANVNVPEFAEAPEAVVPADEQVGQVPARMAGRPAAPVAPRDWDGEAKEYARVVKRKLKAVPNAHRSVFLFELKRELEAAGLLDIEEGLTTQVNGAIRITSK